MTGVWGVLWKGRLAAVVFTGKKIVLDSGVLGNMGKYKRLQSCQWTLAENKEDKLYFYTGKMILSWLQNSKVRILVSISTVNIYTSSPGTSVWSSTLFSFIFSVSGLLKVAWVFWSSSSSNLSSLSVPPLEFLILSLLLSQENQLRKHLPLNVTNLNLPNLFGSTANIFLINKKFKCSCLFLFYRKYNDQFVQYWLEV